MGVHYELSEEEKFYRNALTRMPDGPAALEEAYNAVEDIVNEVEQYVKVRVMFMLNTKNMLFEEQKEEEILKKTFSCFCYKHI